MAGVETGKWRIPFQEMDEETLDVILTSSALSDLSNVVKPGKNMFSVFVFQDHSYNSIKNRFSVFTRMLLHELNLLQIMQK